MNLEKTIKNLRQRGHEVRTFPTAEEAVAYLCDAIHNTEVGIGGSKTVEQLGLYEKLIENNTVYWHWRSKETNIREIANAAPVYITGINAIAETGEILNIDGTGNRLAGQCFGKKKVYYIAGINKICSDFESALFRARNVAAVRNAARFPAATPCKIDGICHDCQVPENVCNALLVVWGPMTGMQTEVILIDGELGF